MESVGAAVIGFGLAGRVFHAPFIAAVPGLALRAIVQRHGDSAADAYPQDRTGVRVVRRVEEVLADADVGLVVVATPNDSHFALAKQALEAGKHVVVDKPLTTTSAEAEQLIQLARDRGRVLVPFHNRRWDGDFLTVRQLLATGRLGRLVSYQSRFDRFRPQQKPNSWKEVPGGAHGVLFDLGPHLIDQALVLFGTPQSISASVRGERTVTAIDDAFDLELVYPNLRVVLGATMLAAEPAPRFLLHGTAGSYRKYGVDPQEPALVGGALLPPPGVDGEWLTEPEAAWGTLRIPAEAASASTGERVRTLPGDYRIFYAAVRDAIAGVAAPPVQPEDAWRVLKLLELARKSAEQRAALPVDLSLPF